jgi:hypothetical protein
MGGMRQKNVAPGSGLGEMFLRTFLDSSTTDYGELFVFNRATRIWVTGVGMGCSSHTGLTTVAVQLGYLAAGLVGTEDLLDIGEIDTVLHDQAGGVYELDDENQWSAQRCDAHQPYLWKIEAPTAQGQNAFDTDKNLHLMLGMVKVGSPSAFVGAAWMTVRVWYPEDE